MFWTGLIISKVPEKSTSYPNSQFLIFCRDLSCSLIDVLDSFSHWSELLTSNVGIQLRESTFLPTPPIPFPSHTTEIVCGSFQSTGWILDGISKQRGNPDMFLLSLCAATCSASEKFRRRLLYWDFLNDCKGLVHRLVSPWRKEQIEICQQLEDVSEINWPY